MSDTFIYKYHDHQFEVTYDGDEDDFWIDKIELIGYDKDIEDILLTKIEDLIYEAASEHFWDNYYEMMTCRAEDRYDYLTDR